MRTCFGITIVLSLLFIVGCGSRTQQAAQNIPTTQKVRVFLPPIAPVGLEPQQAQQYMLAHYWDRFDFSDSLFVSLADSTSMLEAYALYTSLITRLGSDPAPIDSLMRRASISKKMLLYFGWLGEQILREPNSPLRNDELYITVVQAMVNSPLLDQYEKLRPQHQLYIATLNRLGHQANDFRYTLHSGAQSTLYGLRGEYTLLFISNPGCEMCQQMCQQIESSPMLSEMIERGRLKILLLYTDQELDAWQAYREMIPSSWIYAYDKGCVITEQKLYNLEAIPSLYLLDSQKRVLVKDGVDIAHIEQVIDSSN